MHNLCSMLVSFISMSLSRRCISQCCESLSMSLSPSLSFSLWCSVHPALLCSLDALLCSYRSVLTHTHTHTHTHTRTRTRTHTHLTSLSQKLSSKGSL